MSAIISIFQSDFVTNMMSAYLDVVEPPLDTELYRYGFGMFPAAYFIFLDIWTIATSFFSLPKLEGVQDSENSFSLFDELLSYKP